MEDYISQIAGSLPVEMPNLESIKNFDIIALIESTLIGFLPEKILNIYAANRIIFLLGLAFILLLFAVQGYKIFKSLLYVAGAVGFAYVGYNYLLPHIPESITSVIPDMLDAGAVVAIVCALVAVFLTRCAFPLMVMILGAGSGYLLGSMLIYDKLITYFHTLTFLKSPTVKYVIGGAIAAVFGIIFILMFKHLFMAASSFGGSIVGALALQKIVCPAGDQNVLIAFAVLGCAFGIFCIVHQYKQEEKDMEIVF